jgi:hypothetical protein
MTALLQTHKPKNTTLNRLPSGQQTMVLQQRSLFRPKRFGDRNPFVGGEHDAPEGRVEREIVVEGAGVLGYGV